jgi:hypothetical protein
MVCIGRRDCLGLIFGGGERCRALHLMKCSVFVVLLFLFVGCNRRAKHNERELDALLMSGPIDRIVFVDDYKDKTNVIVGDRAAAVLQAFDPTNRVTRKNSGWTRIDFSARVFFYRGSNLVTGIHYTPELKAFARGEYYFATKGTNDVRRFFE